jgi:hypothetical protein
LTPEYTGRSRPARSQRPFYQLAHNLVVQFPGLDWLRKFGTAAANPENARLALASGAALLVYPGGDYEVFRPSWQRSVPAIQPTSIVAQSPFD